MQVCIIDIPQRRSLSIVGGLQVLGLLIVGESAETMSIVWMSVGRSVLWVYKRQMIPVTKTYIWGAQLSTDDVCEAGSLAPCALPEDGALGATKVSNVGNLDAACYPLLRQPWETSAIQAGRVCPAGLTADSCLKFDAAGQSAQISADSATGEPGRITLIDDPVAKEDAISLVALQHAASWSVKAGDKGNSEFWRTWCLPGDALQDLVPHSLRVRLGKLQRRTFNTRNEASQSNTSLDVDGGECVSCGCFCQGGLCRTCEADLEQDSGMLGYMQDDGFQ